MAQVVYKQMGKKITVRLKRVMRKRNDEVKLTTYEMPDEKGRYGRFGGRFVLELLMPALLQLEHSYQEAIEDPTFIEELNGYLKEFIGRETPDRKSVV